MTDLKLIEIAAKWLGLEYKIIAGEVFLSIAKEDGKIGIVNTFDPLHNKNDLWDMIVPKLPNGQIRINLRIQYCSLQYGDIKKEGSLSDLPRAILELIAELYESEADK